MEHLSNDHEDLPYQHENSHTSYVIKQGIHLMENETTTWSEFPNGRKAIVEQILTSEEIINPKEHNCESHNQGRKVNHLSKIIWDEMKTAGLKNKFGLPTITLHSAT